MSSEVKNQSTYSSNQPTYQTEKDSPEFDLWIKTVKQRMIASLRRRGSVL